MYMVIIGVGGGGYLTPFSKTSKPEGRCSSWQ